MIILNPALDGITHINVYSKGKTSLGRFLTNFAYSPINIPDDGYFASIEAYWYWLGCKDDRLRTTYGFKAKELGRKLGASDWNDGEEFKLKIRTAITEKILMSNYFEEFRKSSLPFTHYYVYGSKVVIVDKANWIIEHLEKLRSVYK